MAAAYFTRYYARVKKTSIRRLEKGKGEGEGEGEEEDGCKNRLPRHLLLCFTFLGTT